MQVERNRKQLAASLTSGGRVSNVWEATMEDNYWKR